MQCVCKKCIFEKKTTPIYIITTIHLHETSLYLLQKASDNPIVRICFSFNKNSRLLRLLKYWLPKSSFLLNFSSIERLNFSCFVVLRVSVCIHAYMLCRTREEVFQHTEDDEKMSSVVSYDNEYNTTIPTVNSLCCWCIHTLHLRNSQRARSTGNCQSV